MAPLGSRIQAQRPALRVLETETQTPPGRRPSTPSRRRRRHPLQRQRRRPIRPRTEPAMARPKARDGLTGLLAGYAGRARRHRRDGLGQEMWDVLHRFLQHSEQLRQWSVDPGRQSLLLERRRQRGYSFPQSIPSAPLRLRRPFRHWG